MKARPDLAEEMKRRTKLLKTTDFHPNAIERFLALWEEIIPLPYFKFRGD